MSDEDIAFVEHYAQEALHLAQATGNHTIFARSLTNLADVHQLRGNLPDAARHLAEAVRISRQEGDQGTLAHSLMSLGHQAYWEGAFRHTISLGQEAARVSRAIHDGLTELFSLAFLCLAHWSGGDYRQALDKLHEGLTKAQERENTFVQGRLTNTRGWFYRECGDLSRAVEADHESTELGRRYRHPNVEISALINVGLDYLALGQYDRAASYLIPTLDRVQREAFGAHRWRWTIRLLTGLAELSYATEDYDQALRYMEEGLHEAQRTSSQKYVALGACPRISVFSLWIPGESGSLCIQSDQTAETLSALDGHGQFTDGRTPCQGPLRVHRMRSPRIRP
jgi:tetratricopeptide (TPR) repeat protein